MVVQVQNTIDATTPMSEVDLVLARSKPAGVSLFARYSHGDHSLQLICDSTVTPTTESDQMPASIYDLSWGTLSSVHKV
jgi:hypothetical protein